MIQRRHGRWGWMRGRLFRVGTSDSVFEAIIPSKADSKPLQFKDYSSLLVIKSAHYGSYYAELIMENEEFVYTSLGSNPHILKFYGHDYTFSKDHDGGNYGRVSYNLFYKNVLGGSLSDFIERTRVRLREPQARAHTRSILKGLEFIHQKSFVHCNLKPSNILLIHCDDNPYGVDGLVAKIADFGLSKRINDDFESGNEVTCKTQDQASKIWALGYVVLEMLTGNLSWDENLGEEELYNKISIETPFIPSCLTPIAKDFLLKCFTRDPNQRPSAQILLDHPFALKTKEQDSKEEDPEEEDSEEEDPEEEDFVKDPEEDLEEEDSEEDPEEDPQEEPKERSGIGTTYTNK
ncbi:hypothetical protein F8388_008134 [Cannabis sativa]|nr:hypothetical protein F8388_008134 [Cannabis sativa]